MDDLGCRPFFVLKLLRTRVLGWSCVRLEARKSKLEALRCALVCTVGSYEPDGGRWTTSIAYRLVNNERFRFNLRIFVCRIPTVASITTNHVFIDPCMTID